MDRIILDIKTITCAINIYYILYQTQKEKPLCFAEWFFVEIFKNSKWV
jgi:hypothetical protein